MQTLLKRGWISILQGVLGLADTQLSTQKRRSGDGGDQEQGRAQDCDEPEAVDEGGLGSLDEFCCLCWAASR